MLAESSSSAATSYNKSEREVPAGKGHGQSEPVTQLGANPRPLSEVPGQTSLLKLVCVAQSPGTPANPRHATAHSLPAKSFCTRPR